jgi:hypothetical protein
MGQWWAFCVYHCERVHSPLATRPATETEEENWKGKRFLCYRFVLEVALTNLVLRIPSPKSVGRNVLLRSSAHTFLCGE